MEIGLEADAVPSTLFFIGRRSFGNTMSRESHLGKTGKDLIEWITAKLNHKGQVGEQAFGTVVKTPLGISAAHI